MAKIENPLEDYVTVAEFAKRAGKSAALRYFSFSHLEVEKNHQVFERAISQKIDSIYLPPALRESMVNSIPELLPAFPNIALRVIDDVGQLGRRVIDA